MSRLSERERTQRLRFDFEVVGRLRAPWLQCQGFQTRASLLAGRQGILSGTDGAAPPFLRVHYGFPTLAGPGRMLPSVTACFDLLGGGNYPFTAPVVTVLPPIPWVPRVSRSTGMVCIGGAWAQAKGQMLLAHLVIQVARFLNLAEPHSGRDMGLQPDATAHWRANLGGRPLNKTLSYPTVPAELTHGVATPRRRFQVVGQAPQPSAGFRVRGAR